MKNLMLIAVLSVAFSMQLCAQKSDSKNVSEKVKTAFSTKFPDAQKIKWQLEDETEWEAEFKMNGREYSANFDTEGNWKETEYEIKNSELPSNIRNILDKNFTDYEISDGEVVETSSGKSYELKLEVGEEELDVTIDPLGNFTKKQESDEIDENDED
ncbi:MAG TPA: PepSY-like domain-containing protein [Saprospiraceae bacterium]|nr:PepSY-like domain-containing protein [Saprospiraceae bacterium]